jgi:predicted GNAT family acetyltransferase
LRETRRVTLIETTEPEEIRPLLTALLRHDPVRNTVLGTIWAGLDSPGTAPWAAFGPVGAPLAVRSGERYPVTLSTGWDEVRLAELALLLARIHGLTGVSGNAAAVASLVHALGREVSCHGQQRLFRLDEFAAPSGVAGQAVRAGAEHRELLIAWVRAFGTEVHVAAREDWGQLVDEALAERQAWVWRDTANRPVSTAFRRSAVAGSARVGPVYTPPEFRGHGYGSAVTAAATRDILADAAIPVLFTELANATSNKIYVALGYYPVEDRAYVSFA